MVVACHQRIVAHQPADRDHRAITLHNSTLSSRVPMMMMAWFFLSAEVFPVLLVLPRTSVRRCSLLQVVVQTVLLAMMMTVVLEQKRVA